MPLRDLRVDAEERLAELVDDAGAAQLRERIVGRPRRDDRAVGQRLAGPVVVGDDHLEAARLRLRDLLDRGDAAVDGQHEPAALVGEPLERRRARRRSPRRSGSAGASRRRRRARAAGGRRASSRRCRRRRSRRGRRCACRRRPPRGCARTRARMSPSRNGSWGAASRRRGTPAPSSGSVYPRRTRTLAVSSLIPSAWASSVCSPVRARTECPGALVHACDHATGGRRTTYSARVRELFLLDPDVVYLNHGSFGACPRPVFERYQAWQRELEREPSEFIFRRLPGLLADARASSAPTSAPHADDLTFVPNATTGVNIAARALELQPGDEVLATDLEYGACDFTWERLCAAARARATCRAPRRRALRARDRADARRLRRRTSRRRPGSLLPVEEIVARAPGRRARHDRRRRTRARAGRSRPRRARRRLLRRQLPQVAVRAQGRRLPPRAAASGRSASTARSSSWGYAEPATFISRTEQQGTRDSGRLSRRARGDRVRAGARRAASAASRSRATRGRELCDAARHRADRARGAGAADGERAPARSRSPGSRGALFDEHRIEIPTMRPHRDDLLRISVAPYTEREDVERLLDALPRCCSELPAALRDRSRSTSGGARRRSSAHPCVVLHRVPEPDAGRRRRSRRASASRSCGAGTA